MRTASAPLHLHPGTVTRYLAAVLAVGTPLLALPAVTPIPLEALLLVTTFVLLLGGAVLTARTAGEGGVRRLFRGALHWRIGWRSWALVTGAVPAATIAVAAATGTLTSPADGWLSILAAYLVFTFVIGTVFLNLWEEVGWQGLVQRHLTQRHGMAKAAMLTAVPFAILHLPLQLAGVTTMDEALVNVGLLFLLAPAMRYVLGWTDRSTGGSLLAVGVLHASFNASGSMDVLDGGWQHIAALAVIAVVLAIVEARRARARLVAEVAPAGEDHGDAGGVAGSQDLGVAHAASR